MTRTYFRYFLLITAYLTTMGNGCSATNNASLEKLNEGKGVYIKGENFQNDVDLTSILTFSPASTNTMKAIIDGDIVFDDCQFYKFKAHSSKDGKIYLIEFRGNVIFNNCIFKDSLDLSYAVIGGDFSLTNTELMGVTVASNALFRGRNNDFSKTVFYNRVLFSNAKFDNKTSFFGTQFKENANFQGTTFGGHSFWGNSIFEGYAEFGRTMFMQDVDMSECTFNGRSNFGNMKVLMNAFFANSKFMGDTDFSDVQFTGKPIFPNTTFSKGKKGLEGILE